MILKRLHILPELVPFIDTMWQFEADFGVPTEDNRVIAPNGKAKFIYTYSNGLSTFEDGILTPYNEAAILFIGIWDKPVTLVSKARQTGTIGIELTPNGLHRFTPFSAAEIRNQIADFEAIYGISGKELMQRLGNENRIEDRVALLQQYLVQIVRSTNRNNLLIDYSTELIRTSCGLITIKELERKTGYSKRYLDLLFKDHLGISPKTFGNITRFQHFYAAWANTDTHQFYLENLHELYYDQAHFIKEFKRYTGYSPKQYASSQNNFGKLFYKNH